MQYLLSAFFCLLLGNVYAQLVTKTEALSVASMQLQRSMDVFSEPTLSVQNRFYVVNTIDSTGWVLVSANKSQDPIIAYNYTGLFTRISNQFPIDSIIDQSLDGTSKTAFINWKKAESGQLNSPIRRSAVAPLLETEWGQGDPYNRECPQVGNVRSMAGCGAIAFAQIMNYYKYPTVGHDSYSYDHDVFGQLSVDFSQQRYDWAGNSTDVISKIVYHCGIALKSNYGLNSTAAEAFTQFALKKYFKFSHTVRSVERSNYSADEWLEIIYNELDNQRPFIYCGDGSGSHTWVCDGYDSNGLLHMNWGWNGKANGYYSDAQLEPLGNNYNENRFLFIGIAPAPNAVYGPNLYFQNDSLFDVFVDTETDQYDTVLYNDTPIAGVVSLSNNGYKEVQTHVVIHAFIDEVFVTEIFVSDVMIGQIQDIRSKKSFALGYIKPGHHELKLIMDPDNVIAEADETDNIIVRDIYVHGRLDLPNIKIIDSPDYPAKLFSHSEAKSLLDQYMPNDFKFKDSLNLLFSVQNDSEFPVTEPFTILVSMGQLPFSFNSDSLTIDDFGIGWVESFDDNGQKTWGFTHSIIVDYLAPHQVYTIDTIRFGSIPLSHVQCSVEIDTNDSIEESLENDNNYSGMLMLNAERPKYRGSFFFSFDRCNVSYYNSNDSITIPLVGQLFCDGVLLAQTDYPLGVESRGYIYMEYPMDHIDSIKSYSFKFLLRDRATYTILDSLVGSYTPELVGTSTIVDYSVEYLYQTKVDSNFIGNTWSFKDSTVATIRQNSRGDSIFIRWNKEVAGRYTSVNLIERTKKGTWWSNFSVNLTDPSFKAVIEIVGDSSFCTTQQITLKSNFYGSTYWSTGQLGPEIKVGHGTYFYHISNVPSYVFSDTILLVDRKTIDMNIVLSDSILCPGDTVTATASSPVVWPDLSESVSHQFYSAGAYPYSYFDAGCGIIQHEVNLKSKAKSKLKIDAIKKQLCLGDTIALRTNQTVLWSTGEVAQSIAVCRPGTYEASFIWNGTECGYDPGHIEISGNSFSEQPEIGVVGQDLVVVNYDNLKQTWFKNGVKLTTPLLTDPDEYAVVLVDENGCALTASQYITGIASPSNSASYLSFEIVLTATEYIVRVPTSIQVFKYELYTVLGELVDSDVCQSSEIHVQKGAGSILSIIATSGVRYGIVLGQ